MHLLLRLLEIFGVLVVILAAFAAWCLCSVSSQCSRDEERFAAAEAAGEAELIAAFDSLTGFGGETCADVSCDGSKCRVCAVAPNGGLVRVDGGLLVGGSAHDRRKARRAAARVGKVRAA